MTCNKHYLLHGIRISCEEITEDDLVRLVELDSQTSFWLSVGICEELVTKGKLKECD